MPSHSPDGARVAFVSNRGGKPEIWIAGRDGTGERKLNGTAYAASTPKWSPDGTRLLFGLSAPGAPHRIHLVPVSAGVPSETPLRDAVAPSWSASGDAIFYWTGQQLWRAKLDGSGAKMLGQFPIHWMNSGSVASGNDTSHLYAQAGKPFALARADLESGKEEVIADGLATPFLAASRRFVYFLTQKEKDLYSIPLAGGPPRRIGQVKFENPGRLILGLSVSPDDREMVWAVTAEQRSDIMLLREFR